MAALGDFFFASLDAKRVTCVPDLERWAWLMPHRVAVWIYWHAAVLVLRKGIAFHGHPKHAPGDYRDLVRQSAASEAWGSCPAFASAPAEATAAPAKRPYVWRAADVFPWK